LKIRGEDRRKECRNKGKVRMGRERNKKENYPNKERRMLA
jgi:hypothetical protein